MSNLFATVVQLVSLQQLFLLSAIVYHVNQSNLCYPSVPVCDNKLVQICLI